MTMWGTCCKRDGNRDQLHTVSVFEAKFAEPMLFGMVLRTQTERPKIGWLQAGATIRPRSNMRALDVGRHTAHY
jgi:hypothetical protein